MGVSSRESPPLASPAAWGSFCLLLAPGSSLPTPTAHLEVSPTSLPPSLPRKKLPLHHLVHRRHLPPCDLGDCLRLLETLQKVWVTLQGPPTLSIRILPPTPAPSSVLSLVSLSLFKNYLFLAVLGLHCCTWAFPSCSESGDTLQFQWVGFSLWWLLFVVASLLAERGL